MEKTNSPKEMSVIPAFSFLESIEDVKIGDIASILLSVMGQIQILRARIPMMLKKERTIE